MTEKELEYQRKYREKNREKIRARNREYKRKSYSQDKEVHKIWRLNNPEKIKGYAQKYRDSGAQKWSVLKSRYGITKEDYELLLKTQENTCPICKENFDTRKIYVDHNHKNGEVRGLIHRECNALLGFAREKIDVLENAINYLKKYENDNKKTTIECSS